MLVGTSMHERLKYDDAAKAAAVAVGLDRYSICNLGCGGDKITNILYRFETMKVLDFYPSSAATKQPKLIVLEGGANDVGLKKVDIGALVGDIAAVAKIIRTRFPKAHLVLKAAMPRLGDASEAVVLERIVAFNKRLRLLALEGLDNASFDDHGEEFLTASGNVNTALLIEGDPVHLNQASCLPILLRFPVLVSDVFLCVCLPLSPTGQGWLLALPKATD